MQKEDDEEEDSGFHYMRQSACLVNGFPFTRIQIPFLSYSFLLRFATRRSFFPSSLQDIDTLQTVDILDYHTVRKIPGKY